MKKIGSLKLGLSFAGCFLGAGYVSGQELWQFFGSFGTLGVAGLLLALLVLSAAGVLMLKLNRLTGYDEADKLILGGKAGILRHAVTFLELLLLFCIGTVMTAGVGALAHQLLGLPTFVGGLLFAAAVAAVSLAGLAGMVSVFSATVPLLCLISLSFGVYALCRFGFSVGSSDSGNPLMGSWVSAALSFASYNLFAGIAVIAPLGRHMKSSRSVFGGVLVGAGILLCVAGSVLLCVSAAPKYADAELPMLAFASGLSPVLAALYGLLLLLAMFGTSVSALVALTNTLKLKSRMLSAHPKAPTLLCAALMFCGSLYGFGDLVGFVYPLLGYLSFVFIILMTIHYIKVKHEQNNLS